MSIVVTLILIVNVLQLFIQVHKVIKQWQREVRMQTRREIALSRRQHGQHHYHIEENQE